jgi:hypothetical protein
LGVGFGHRAPFGSPLICPYINATGMPLHIGKETFIFQLLNKMIGSNNFTIGSNKPSTG